MNCEQPNPKHQEVIFIGEIVSQDTQSIGQSSKIIDYYQIALNLIDKYQIISFEETIYYYRDGIYKPIGVSINKEIQQTLLIRGLTAKASITEPVRQIQRYIINETGIDEYPFNTSTNLIPVENGVIKIEYDTGEIGLIDHSPNYRFSYKLPIVYDPNENDGSIMQYLESLGCNIDMLLQIPAHTLLSNLNKNYKKAYLLKGRGNSGKTTYLTLLNQYFFGGDNCSNIPLQALMNERFKPAGLVGKIANIADELSKIKLGDVAKFKEITGGGKITIERKFEHPYSYQNRAVLIFATNEYPPIDEVDDAFWARWEIIEFTKSFNVDPLFEERTFTQKNLSSFLNLVIKRMREILNEGSLARGKSVDEIKQIWLYDSDSVYKFKESILIKDIHNTIVKQELFTMYEGYCEANQLTPKYLKEFSQRMQSFGALDVQVDKGNGRFRCFKGFNVRTK